MKDFGEMTMGEFRHAQKIAYLDMWSGSAKFMLDVSGYKFLNGCMPVDKWEIYNTYKGYPSELRAIVKGNHPIIKRVVKHDFDEIRCKQLELGLLPETE